MNFTNNPIERLMKEAPRYSTPGQMPAPKNSLCHGCGYWRGMACVGICYRRLKSTGGAEARASGHVGPKS